MAGKFVARSKKKAFMGLSGEDFGLMEGFTSLTTNKNAEEYARKYVTDDFETTDVVGISTSMDFEFDLFEGNEVHEKMVEIIDGEKIGDEAVVTILQVDMTGEEPYKAIKRDFALIPASEGDGTEAYKYGGTFRVKGSKVEGTATSTDNWKTATFIEEA